MRRIQAQTVKVLRAKSGLWDKGYGISVADSEKRGGALATCLPVWHSNMVSPRRLEPERATAQNSRPLRWQRPDYNAIVTACNVEDSRSAGRGHAGQNLIQWPVSNRLRQIGRAPRGAARQQSVRLPRLSTWAEAAGQRRQPTCGAYTISAASAAAAAAVVLHAG